MIRVEHAWLAAEDPHGPALIVCVEHVPLARDLSEEAAERLRQHILSLDHVQDVSLDAGRRELAVTFDATPAFLPAILAETASQREAWAVPQPEDARLSPDGHDMAELFIG